MRSTLATQVLILLNLPQHHAQDERLHNTKCKTTHQDPFPFLLNLEISCREYRYNEQSDIQKQIPSSCVQERSFCIDAKAIKPWLPNLCPRSAGKRLYSHAANVDSDVHIQQNSKRPPEYTTSCSTRKYSLPE